MENTSFWEKLTFMNRDALKWLALILIVTIQSQKRNRPEKDQVKQKKQHTGFRNGKIINIQ